MDKIEIFVGTYEEFVLGFKVEQPNKKEKNYVLKKTLASRDHTASVRCIVSTGDYVATGGADDRAVIYDILKRSIAHIIIDHEGTINTLDFSPDGTHLFVGSDDGSIGVTRMGTWVTEKIWKNAHKGSPVKYLSVHPSGKLALSIGNDLVLRTWNLIKGRQAYATNLNNKPSLGKIVESVKWSPDGKNFMVSGAKVVEVMSVDEAKVVLVVECESKPSTICWVDEIYFLVGLENGDILHVNLLSGDKSVIKLFDKQRIKGISSFGNFVAVITSAGDLALCKIKKGKLFEKICSTNIECRPTCITLLQHEYEVELDNNDASKVEEEQPVMEKSVKTNTKPKVVVEVETTDVDNSVAQNISIADNEIQSKKRRKGKANLSVSSEITPKASNKRSKHESVNEHKIDDKDSELAKSELGHNNSLKYTPNKKSKKKKNFHQSLIVEGKKVSSHESKKRQSIV